MSNCCAEVFGYDNHNRQRGNDEPDAPLLVEGENSAEEVDVVIGAVESDEADHKAADDLEAALGIKSKELAAALIGFWRNLRALVGTIGTRTAFGITTGYNADNPNQLLIVHLFANASPLHIWCLRRRISGLFCKAAQKDTVERHVEHQRMLGNQRRSLLGAAGGGIAQGVAHQESGPC